MEIFNLLLTSAYAPFTAALAAVLLFFTMEVVLTVLVGLGFSDLIDSLVSPDSMPDTSFTNWLLLREIPLSLVIVAFLVSFGFAGLAVVTGVKYFFNAQLAQYISIPLALWLGVGGLRVISRILTRFKVVSSTAISAESFINQEVVLSSVSAYKGHAGAATFKDPHGQTHQVMVEPLTDSEKFVKGDKLVLKERASLSLFFAQKA